VDDFCARHVACGVCGARKRLCKTNTSPYLVTLWAGLSATIPSVCWLTCWGFRWNSLRLTQPTSLGLPPAPKRKRELKRRAPPNVWRCQAHPAHRNHHRRGLGPHLGGWRKFAAETLVDKPTTKLNASDAIWGFFSRCVVENEVMGMGMGSSNAYADLAFLGERARTPRILEIRK
jgi:hypothetical protein